MASDKIPTDPEAWINANARWALRRFFAWLGQEGLDDAAGAELLGVPPRRMVEWRNFVTNPSAEMSARTYSCTVCKTKYVMAGVLHSATTKEVPRVPPEALRALRATHGLSVGELGVLVGVKPDSIESYERGGPIKPQIRFGLLVLLREAGIDVGSEVPS